MVFPDCSNLKSQIERQSISMRNGKMHLQITTLSNNIWRVTTPESTRIRRSVTAVISWTKSLQFKIQMRLKLGGTFVILRLSLLSNRYSFILLCTHSLNTHLEQQRKAVHSSTNQLLYFSTSFSYC